VSGDVEFTREEMHDSLAARFARIAGRHRDRPAVVTTRATRTYAELDATSARIAHALLAFGGPGVESVAVLLDGDVEAAETFVGTLRAGKRYVPIDPRLPDARAASILEDSQARIVLSDAAHLSRAATLAPAGVHVADVTALDPAWPHTLPPTTIDPDTDLWIVYTSGSTGQPKGWCRRTGTSCSTSGSTPTASA
jgi:non-ribosomal peptide synthetase component F